MRFEFRCKKCKKIWWTDKNGIFKCSCGNDMEIAEVASTTLFYSNNAAWRKTIGKYLKKRSRQANMKKLLVLFCLLVFGVLPGNAQTPSPKDLLLGSLSSAQIITFGVLHGDYRTDNDFVAKILPCLRRRGFECLALEFQKSPHSPSFHNAIQNYAYGKITRKKMHPSWKRMERKHCPGMFALIDVAKDLHMQFAFYDADEDLYRSWDWGSRDKIAFDNLKKIIFEKNQEAKVVIVCGVIHINEEPYRHIYWWNDATIKTEYLGYHLNKHFANRSLTVSLVGKFVSKKYAPFCDIIIDLGEDSYYYNRESRDEEEQENRSCRTN